MNRKNKMKIPVACNKNHPKDDESLQEDRQPNE